MKNPFLQSVKLHVYIKENKMQVIQATDISSIRGTFTEEKEWEKETFVKLYNEKSYFKVFEDISDTASKIFLYVVYNLAPKQDIIELKAERVMLFAKIKSKVTYYKYVQELIDSALINRKSNSEYWVNPLFLFNGNRIDYYREHCPECIEEINITAIQESKTIKKKKELMQYYKCKSYYGLKSLLGDAQINQILSNQLQLKDVRLLK